jgi:hypothetical protein
MPDFYAAYEARRVELCHEQTAKVDALRAKAEALMEQYWNAYRRRQQLDQNGPTQESYALGEQMKQLKSAADRILKVDLKFEQDKHVEIASGKHPELGALSFNAEKALTQSIEDRATRISNERVRARAAWDAALIHLARKKPELLSLAQTVVDAEQAACCFLDPTISALLATCETPVAA